MTPNLPCPEVQEIRCIEGAQPRLARSVTALTISEVEVLYPRYRMCGMIGAPTRGGAVNGMRRYRWGLLVLVALCLWLPAGPVAAQGTILSCAGWLHQVFKGFPSSVLFGVYASDLEPGTRLVGTLEGGGRSEQLTRQLGSGRIVVFRIGISQFGPYVWEVLTTEEVSLATGTVDVGPGEETCNEEVLQQQAEEQAPTSPEAEEPEPAAPGEEEPAAEEQEEPAQAVEELPLGEDGGFPWEAVIAGGAALGFAGFLVARSAGRPGAGAPAGAAAGAARRAAVRDGTRLSVALSVSPPGPKEEPVDSGTQLSVRVRVTNQGSSPAVRPEVHIVRTDHDEDRTVAERALRSDLLIGDSVTEEFTLETDGGRLVSPGLARVSLVAAASAANAGVARSEEASVHVGRPVLVVGLEADGDGSTVPEGTDVVYRVRVGNVGRGTARNIMVFLKAMCSSPKGDSKDYWERSVYVDELDPNDAEEEEFVITPRVPGRAGGATLVARASLQAQDVPPSQSATIRMGISPIA